LVSLITKAEPVPAFVSAKPVALPLLVSVKEVGVVNPEANVKPMLRPSVVRIVLPESYACCKVTLSALAGQETNSLVTSSRQMVVAVFPVVVSELNCVVLPRTICPVPLGAKVRSSLLPVVISVVTPLNVNPPVKDNPAKLGAEVVAID